MVCDRCILTVRRHLDEVGLHYKNIQLGSVELSEEPTDDQLAKLRLALQSSGFEVLDDTKKRLVEQIKNTIISLVQGYDYEDDLNMKLSALLEKKLKVDYHYLATLFPAVEGITIEKYAILQRVEKVKELLMYGEMSMSEIADQLRYSSVQHLSQQFKKVTGMTPSEFRALKENGRKPLDKIL